MPKTSELNPAMDDMIPLHRCTARTVSRENVTETRVQHPIVQKILEMLRKLKNRLLSLCGLRRSQKLDSDYDVMPHLLRFPTLLCLYHAYPAQTKTMPRTPSPPLSLPPLSPSTTTTSSSSSCFNSAYTSPTYPNFSQTALQRDVSAFIEEREQVLKVLLPLPSSAKFASMETGRNPLTTSRSVPVIVVTDFAED
ncbi:hypothetical protein ABKN59_011065 [Abortiporus biennis]